MISREAVCSVLTRTHRVRKEVTKACARGLRGDVIMQVLDRIG